MDYSQFKQLEFRRKFWKFIGAEIFITSPASQQEVGYIHMKGWKLREDIRLYTNRSKQQELLQIHARKIIDIGATYDVIDSTSGQPFFAARRKGLKSIFVRDHWTLLDTAGNEFGAIQETSSGLAIARRWLEILPYVGGIIGMIFMFVPQTYTITAAGENGTQALVGTIIHRKNPFIVKMSLDTSTAQVTVHPYIPMASTALLSIIDAVKNN